MNPEEENQNKTTKRKRKRRPAKTLMPAFLFAAGLLLLGGCATPAEIASTTTPEESEAAAKDPEPVEEPEEVEEEAAGEKPEAAAEPDVVEEEAEVEGEEPEPVEEPEVVDEEPEAVEEEAEETVEESSSAFSLSDIPAFDSDPYVFVNDNTPFFTEEEITTDVFETYSELDELGRCGVAYANICRELMPTEERGDISAIHPSGWYNNPYDFIDGGYLYNRCHLIAYELGAENDNERNLITGTRYLNINGMLPFENMVADYVKETDNHVLYRVTPVFEGDNLVADGVLMEAYSVEDEGDGIEYCIYCYNVQPGVEIDYATGYNRSDGTLDTTDPEDEEEQTYVLNTNTKKFHYPYCASVTQMKPEHRKEYTATRSEIIDMGYSPCGNCKP